MQVWKGGYSFLSCLLCFQNVEAARTEIVPYIWNAGNQFVQFPWRKAELGFVMRVDEV